MKKTIKLAVVAALALGTTSAFATNGSNLIATGVKARGMGGASIGVAQGAESGLSNPALITKIKSDNEISFGGTVFMPDVENQNNIGFGTRGADSAADMSVIPEVSVASKITDNFYSGWFSTVGSGRGVARKSETKPDSSERFRVYGQRSISNPKKTVIRKSEIFIDNEISNQDSRI
jgi:long-chain fatty acid transport protein